MHNYPRLARNNQHDLYKRLKRSGKSALRADFSTRLMHYDAIRATAKPLRRQPCQRSRHRRRPCAANNLTETGSVAISGERYRDARVHGSRLCDERLELLGKREVRMTGVLRLLFAHHVDHLNPAQDHVGTLL